MGKTEGKTDKKWAQEGRKFPQDCIDPCSVEAELEDCQAQPPILCALQRLVPKFPGGGVWEGV